MDEFPSRTAEEIAIAREAYAWLRRRFKQDPNPVLTSNEDQDR
jgi:hypothetical protein